MSVSTSHISNRTLLTALLIQHLDLMYLIQMSFFFRVAARMNQKMSCVHAMPRTIINMLSFLFSHDFPIAKRTTKFLCYQHERMHCPTGHVKVLYSFIFLHEARTKINIIIKSDSIIKVSNILLKIYVLQ